LRGFLYILENHDDND
ncbi:unnamed protein product, partial [Adineta steineri]